MAKVTRILIIITGHGIERVKNKWGDFDLIIEKAFYKSGVNKEYVAFNSYDLCHNLSDISVLNILNYNGIVFTGSPHMINESLSWMDAGSEVIKSAVRNNVPVLGICFGHQLLAQTFGCKVIANPLGSSIGTRKCFLNQYKTDLLYGLPKQFDAQVSHKDYVISIVKPFRAIINSEYNENFAIAYNDITFGVQFHPEWDIDITKKYLKERENTLTKEHGRNYVNNQIKNLRHTPKALSILQNFFQICKK